MVEAGKAPFRDLGAPGQRELLQRVSQKVETAKAPVIHIGAALQRQELQLLQGHCWMRRWVAPGAFLEPNTKGESAPPGLLTEVAHALVVDGTATGIHSLHRNLPELQELGRKMATLIWTDPLLVLKPRVRSRVMTLPGSQVWPS